MHFLVKLTLGGLFAFSHALVHEFVYSQIPEPTQHLLHGMVADELVRVAGSAPSRVAREVVRHARIAGQSLRVMEFSLPLAQEALGLFDWQTALAHTERALALQGLLASVPRRVVLPLREVRGEALLRLGRWDEAHTALSELVSMAEGFGELGAAADALCLLSHMATVQGKSVEARTLAIRALEIAEEREDPVREIAALVCIHRALQSLQPFESRIPIYRDVVQPKFRNLLARLKASAEVPLAARVHRWLARVARTLGENAAARIHLEEGLRLGRACEDNRLVVELYYLKIDLVGEEGDEDSIIAAYRAGLQVARFTNDPKTLSDLLCNLGSRLKEFSRFEEAEGYLQEARKWAEKLGSNELLCMAHGNLASLFEASGQWEQAHPHHDRHLQLSMMIGNRGGVLASTIGLARCGMKSHAPEVCLKLVGGIVWPNRGEDHEQVEVAILEAQAHHRLGRQTETTEALRQAVDRAETTNDAYWIAQALLARVDLAGGGAVEYAPADDLSRAVEELRLLSEKWPTSVPLRTQYHRAVAMRDRLDVP